MDLSNEMLAIVLPVGSLEQACIDLFRKAGYCIERNGRAYKAKTDDPQIDVTFMRPQEIPIYVARGDFDCGVAGFDCIVEADQKEALAEIGELVFSKVSRRPTKWVLAVPQESEIQTVDDLSGCLISTEFVFMTKRWLSKRGIEATVERSWGATESKPACGLCDAIVEVTETGSSLRSNGLRIVAEILESTPRFIANADAFQQSWKQEKMQDIYLMLQSTIAAEGKVQLIMNVPSVHLPLVLELLPAMKKPTISDLSDRNWQAVSTIIDESQVRHLVPKLMRIGADDIVELPVNKIVRRHTP